MTKRIRPYVLALGAAALVAPLIILQACGGNDPVTNGGKGGTTGAGTAGTTGSGVAGTTGSGGTDSAGTSGGTAGVTGSGGTSAGFPPQPSCDTLTTAAGVAPTKSGACTPDDPQLCYKTCGPVKEGAKSETCTGGVYAEMSGCTFDNAKNYMCYKVPAAANPACPTAAPPQASQACTVDVCNPCNTLGGLPGGHYNDSGGADKIGYCVCQAANSAGTRTWSCASDTAWPCPAGLGC
jgi:hypothetical protein